MKTDHEKMPILGMTYDEVLELFRSRCGRGKYHAGALYREIFQRGSGNWASAPEFVNSPKLVPDIQRDFDFHADPVVETRQSRDGTTKFVSRLSDGARIESVIIPAEGRVTLCLSSQVGCRMGCIFCRTGKMGLVRNLTPSEIMGQVHRARFDFGVPVRNIVFMGMGEPFDNFDNVMQAVRVLSEDRGFNIARRRITLSTAGRIDGIQRLSRMTGLRPQLAVSLNAGNDALRSSLMPINRAMPLARLQAALIDYPLERGEAILLEYILLKGINDRREDARAVAEFAAPLRAKVNLIPYNPGADSGHDPGKRDVRSSDVKNSGQEEKHLVPPSASDTDRFCGYLVDEKVFVRRRSSRGKGVMAACGQLGSPPV